MKFRIFGRDVVIGKRLFGIGKDDTYFGMVNSYGTDNANASLLASYHGFVYACINRVAESVASYEPIIYQRKGDQLVALTTHPLLDLLNKPGGSGDRAVNISRFDLFFATAAFQLLQGDCYWYMAKGVTSGKPREVTVLRSDKVGKELDDNGDITRFFVRTVGGEKVYIEIDEMVVIPGFDPMNPYGAKGVTAAGLDLIKTDEFTTLFTKNFFKNNAGVNGVMTLKGEVTKNAFSKFVRAWRDKYEGVDNAGKMAILRDTDAEFTKVGLGLDELDMGGIRNMTKEDVAQMFGVPMALLGKSEQAGLGRANVEAFEYIFAKYTIEPKLQRLDDILQFMLERYYGGQGLVVGHEDIIPEDEQQELAERTAGVDKWLTRNEIRREEGLDPIDGGDQLFVPLNNIPVNQSDLAVDPTAKRITLRRKVVLAPKKKEQNSLTFTSEQKEAFRLRIMRNQAAYERQYKKVLRPIFTAQEKEALKNLEAHASSLTKDLDQKLFDDAAADQKMVENLKPTLIQLGKDQGALAMTFAGEEEIPFRMTAEYERYITDSTRRMASSFNDETLVALNKTLSEGIQLGESIGKLQSRIENVYVGVKGYRANRIARTETLKAGNAATEDAYRQIPYVKKKQWVVNPGACEQCIQFKDKELDLGEVFLPQGSSYTVPTDEGERTVVNDYEDIYRPPLHPNCRCTIAPVR